MTDRPFNILLVEDNPVDARMIQRILSRADGIAATVRHAATFRDAQNCVASNRFDVILLDLMLPDTNGGLQPMLELLSASAHTPIVVLTGLADTQLGISAVRAGAQDYLVKEKCDVETIVRSMQYAIERSRHAADELRLRDVQQQLALAASIQKARYPKQPPRLHGYDVAAGCIPAEAVGGDYFDYIPLADGSWILAVGDASGHGLGPAMVMSDTRASLRTLATLHDDPGAILRQLNRILIRDLGVEMFMTLILIRLHAERGKIEYAAAGHDGLILDHQMRVRAKLHACVPPLHVIPELTAAVTQTVDFAPGETLLLITDGISESRTKDGELFGERSLFRVLAECRELSADAIVTYLLEQSQAMSIDNRCDDDRTILLVRRDDFPRTTVERF